MNQQDMIADMDFSGFKRKVKLSFDLDLECYKRPQMERRLRANMDKCGAGSFQQYFTFMQNDEKLRDEFLDRLTINVSELFRNPDQFETLRNRVLPELLARASRASALSSVSVWSAGCSYGAEPYTLAIILDEVAPGGRHSITATDIDEKMLARANAGVFQEPEMRGVTKARIAKYFTKTPEGYAANSSLKRWFKFKKHNLLKSQIQGAYDLILCRNVVIYFTDETKSALYRRFYDSLNPGGYLFVGGTERINNSVEIGFENPIPFFYRKPVKN